MEEKVVRASGIRGGGKPGGGVRRGRRRVPVIDLANRRERREGYREGLRDAAEAISVMSQELFNRSVALAMAGPWKEWSEGQPVGAAICLNDDMLLECGDEAVASLAELSWHARRLVDFLRARGN